MSLSQLGLRRKNEALGSSQLILLILHSLCVITAAVYSGISRRCRDRLEKTSECWWVKENPKIRVKAAVQHGRPWRHMDHWRGERREDDLRAFVYCSRNMVVIQSGKTEQNDLTCDFSFLAIVKNQNSISSHRIPLSYLWPLKDGAQFIQNRFKASIFSYLLPWDKMHYTGFF